MDARRGAGPAGGLLFVVVLAFVAYLAVSVVVGLARLLLALAFTVALVALAARVVRRR